MSTWGLLRCRREDVWRIANYRPEEVIDMWECYVMNWNAMQKRIDRFVETEDPMEFLLCGENPEHLLRLIEEMGKFYKEIGADSKVKVLRAQWKLLKKVTDIAVKLYTMNL